jgi:hypothetical protein
MTTNVIIQAHCSADKEVKVIINDNTTGSRVKVITLQDGETSEQSVYDGLEIGIQEVLKTPVIETLKYNALTKINHDHKNVDEGDTLTLDATQAAGLLAIKAVELADDASPPADDADRQQAIIDAIKALDAQNPDLWMKDGRPEVKAIKAITGRPVLAAKRDEAWVLINAPVAE